jgi:hypothetical protein
VIWHQHKGKAEKDKPELHSDLFLDPIEVHIMNIDSIVCSEQIHCLFCVLGMQVDSYYFLLFGLDAIDDALERLTSSTANVEEVSTRKGHVIDEAEVCCDCEEGADKQVVQGCCQLFQVFQH